MKRSGLLLAILVWAVGALSLAGGAGPWNDDHSLSWRDPQLGDIRWRQAWTGVTSGFSRPVYWLVTPGLITVCEGRFWAARVAAACAFLAAGAALRFFLGGLGAGRVSRDIAMILFLACPALWQCALWPTATGATMGLAVSLSLLGWACRWSHRPGVVRALALSGGAFLVACFNEQPAAMMCGLALAPALARLRAGDHRSGLVVALAPIAGSLVYAALLVGLSAHGARGSISSLVGVSQLPTNAARVAEETVRAVTLSGAASELFARGVTVARENLGVAIAVLAAFVALSAAWVRNARPTGPGPTRTKNAQRDMAIAGIAAIVVSLIPVMLVKGQTVESRLVACVVAPCIVAGVGVASCLRPRWRPLAHVAACLAAGVGGIGAVMMLGAHWAINHRSRADALQAREVAAMIGRVPDVVIIPVSVEAWAGPEVTRLFRSAWEAPWSAKAVYQRATRQREAPVGFIGTGFGWTPVVGALPQGLRYDDRWLEPRDRLVGEFELHGSGARIIPWSRVGAFVVDAAGRVRPVGVFAVTPPSGQRREFRAELGWAVHEERGGGVVVSFVPGAKPGTITLDAMARTVRP